MASPIVIRSEALRPLVALGSIQLGAAGYFGELIRSSDPVLAVGGLCRLLETNAIRRTLWDEVLDLCRYGAVRKRAFDYFERGFEHGWSARVFAVSASTWEAAMSAAMAAELVLDYGAATEAQKALYLASGNANHLTAASESADQAGGWRAALPWALRAMLVDPFNARPLQRLYVVLEQAGQGALLEELAAILQARNLYPAIAQVFAATGLLKRGEAALALTRLNPFDDKRVLAEEGLAAYLGHIRALRAQAEEKLGNFRGAYEGFAGVKAIERPANVDPENFYRGTAARGRLPVPALSVGREDIVQMLGFPRSGTTLLENVLAAHPAIETFEEIPALNAAVDRIERVLLGKAPKPRTAEEPYLEARATYYAEIDHRRKKTGATVLIDKLPIRSADAAFIVRLFPEWRYIFSIRHPFDVALSCFKQRFTPNPAMENFRTIAGTARAYDHAMTEWFSKFTLDDERVCYVRYEQLVTEFEATAKTVIGFLGLAWDDSVRDFAVAAERRAAKTPSYEKVRQGLSLGVQSNWRQYRFVFEGKDVAPLKKWAEFFGYPTD